MNNDKVSLNKFSINILVILIPLLLLSLVFIVKLLWRYTNGQKNSTKRSLNNDITPLVFTDDDLNKFKHFRGQYYINTLKRKEKLEKNKAKRKARLEKRKSKIEEKLKQIDQ